jgi:aminodeoxyfutalosine deaminase
VHQFVAALPKVELHVHLVGAASLDTVLTLARNHPECAVPTDEAELRRFYEFTDFAHFIEVYAKVNDLVTTGPDIATLALGLAGDLARNNVRYAEVTVSATSHLRAGIPADELTEVLERSRARALTDHGVELAWIFDIPGLYDGDDGMTSADYAIEHRPAGTVGFGLGGFEADAERRRFRRAFDRARDAGLHCVPHAGETVGPAEIWSALRDLKAERIGHGTSAVLDPELLAHLAFEGVPLEVCPTSNVRTAAVTSLTEHPLPRLLEAGVPITVATDDPGMFHTDLNREYLLCHEEFGLSRHELADLARAGVRASFCSDARKAELLAEIGAVASGRE